MSGLKGSQHLGVALIYNISRLEYGRVDNRLEQMFQDLFDLYNGKWPEYEACQAGYHTIDHALDVALAVARMVGGWNKVNKNQTIPEDLFLIGMAASFFHDSGYVKDKGDMEGRGGKFTFTHVERSMVLAGRYLADKGWPAPAIKTVRRIISLTDFYIEPVVGDRFSSPQEKAVARMVPAADLVAQMADVEYISQINNLFEEFQEGYLVESPESLAQKGVRVFNTAQEIIDHTQSFYEEYVLPRLEKLGGMDHYLVIFFGEDRNPYQENIEANLSGRLSNSRKQWRMLGDVLEEQGAVSRALIDEAISRQNSAPDNGRRQKRGRPISRISSDLIERMNQQTSSERLGDILLEMGVIEPVALCRGLMAQILPGELLAGLKRRELVFLLNVSMLLHNYQKGARVFSHILDMTNQLIDCEASSIMLADHEAGELVIVLPTGPFSEILKGRRLPMDKGLAGWVYQHGQPLSLQNARLDKRFDGGFDDISKFCTRSIMAVPLHINGEWIGVIELLNKKDDMFTEHDMDITTGLVNIVASALGNLLAFQKNAD